MTARTRVAFTEGSIAGVVVARNRRACGSHLARERHYIEPGQQYVTSALPPGNLEVGNTRWLHISVCLDCCPAQYDPRQAVTA